jgi:hypothetical protein
LDSCKSIDRELEVTSPIDAPQEKQTKFTLQYYCDEKVNMFAKFPPKSIILVFFGHVFK